MANRIAADSTNAKVRSRLAGLLRSRSAPQRTHSAAPPAGSRTGRCSASHSGHASRPLIFMVIVRLSPRGGAPRSVRDGGFGAGNAENSRFARRREVYDGLDFNGWRPYVEEAAGQVRRAFRAAA